MGFFDLDRSSRLESFKGGTREVFDDSSSAAVSPVPGPVPLSAANKPGRGRPRKASKPRPRVKKEELVPSSTSPAVESATPTVLPGSEVVAPSSRRRG